MKKLIAVILLLGLLASGAYAFQKNGGEWYIPPKKGNVKIIEQPGKWEVSIEKVDLSLPENKRLLHMAKSLMTEKSSAPKSVTDPDYFDLENYPQNVDESDWVTTGEYKEPGSITESCLSWDEEKELVIRDTHDSESSGKRELLVRDKATHKAKQISEGSFASASESYFLIDSFLSDKRVLYERNYTDYGLNNHYFIYDTDTGESICVASSDYGDLCDLGNKQYLWSTGGSLSIIDMRKFNAGMKDAKYTLINLEENYYCGIDHISPNNRFVHLDIIYSTDNLYKKFRGVYNVKTGEQVAFFELPDIRRDFMVLARGNLEYMFDSGSGSVDDPKIDDFYIVRYKMKKL